MNEFENCKNCKYFAKLRRWDYSLVGSGKEWKSDYDGYACTVFAFDGEHEVIHMLGGEPEHGFCEMFWPAKPEDVEKWKGTKMRFLRHYM